MDFIFYTASVVVAFSGLLVGIILSFISPEEMPTGKKHFPLLQKVIIMSLLVFFINAFELQLITRIAVYLLSIALVVLITNTVAVYPLIAVLLFFGSSNPGVFLTLAVLTFLYGLPSGSLYAATARVNKSKIITTAILKHSSFLIIALLLPLFRNLF